MQNNNKQSGILPFQCTKIVYGELNGSASGVWSLLLASGYIKPTKIITDEDGMFYGKYRLKLTNLEVKTMFQKMVSNWFQSGGSGYNDFIKALLSSDTKAMNYYMNQVALSTFSFLIQGKSRQHLHRNVSITDLFWGYLSI